MSKLANVVSRFEIYVHQKRHVVGRVLRGRLTFARPYVVYLRQDITELYGLEIESVTTKGLEEFNCSFRTTQATF